MSEHGPAPSSPLRWFPEFLSLTRRRIRSQARLLGLALLVGVIAGLGAVAFSIACQAVMRVALDYGAGYRPEGPHGEALVSWIPAGSGPFQPWMLLFVAPIGGLLSGWLVFRFAPEAEGHGTDSVIAAYHSPAGRIRARVPLIKTLASALTIGSGGSGGREGPIAQIGAGFGSVLADLLRLRPVDRRVLMAAGMGAGVAAIFRAPLAGALFAAEVLYWSPEFEPEVIMPAGVASVISYCTFGLFFGFGPLFHIDPQRFHFENAWQLGPYLLLALFMVVLALLYTRSFYGLTHLFRRLPLPRGFKPAVGAFLAVGVGLLLYFCIGNDWVLSVLSFGYGVLQKALEVNPRAPEGLDAHAALTTAGVLLAVALGKILTTGLTIGAGGSGGVFGPSMVIGGCGGGALGLTLYTWAPWLIPDPGAFVIVGMAGFFAAAAKTPFSTLVIVSEMTGDYNLILPTLWVCTFSFLLSDDQSLYSSQVESRSRSPAHQGSYVRQVLTGLTLRSFLSRTASVPTLHPQDPLPVILDRFQEPDALVLPVVDNAHNLLGVVTQEEVALALQAGHARSMLLAADLMRAGMKALRPDAPLDEALEVFVESDLQALPVVEGPQRRLVGMVRRQDIAAAYLRRLHAPRRPVGPSGEQKAE
jgi:CIC family chloride channel protein